MKSKYPKMGWKVLERLTDDAVSENCSDVFIGLVMIFIYLWAWVFDEMNSSAIKYFFLKSL